ncbi:uncharacterized protein LOC141778451 [Sebastes fasciatus]|uniref:uncharacterized protein LOC141778451 n=1 Tax=Sebastes fasciatus TaxID=394691 RepID=UPI003D9E38AB
MNLVKNRTLHPHLRDEEALVVENAIRLAIDSIINVLYGVNSSRAHQYQRLVADRDKEIQRLEGRLTDSETELQLLRRRGCSCGLFGGDHSLPVGCQTSCDPLQTSCDPLQTSCDPLQTSCDPQQTSCEHQTGEQDGFEPGCIMDSEMTAEQQECEMSISLGLFARPPSRVSSQSHESALPSSPSRMGLDQSCTSHSPESSGVSEAVRNLPTSPSSIVIKEEPCDIDTVLIKWEMSEDRFRDYQESTGSPRQDTDSPSVQKQLENIERTLRDIPHADPGGHCDPHEEHLRNKKKGVPMSELTEEAQRLKRAAWRAASRRYYARKVARQQANPSRAGSGPFPSSAGPFPSRSGPFPSRPGPFPSRSGPLPSRSGPFPSRSGPFPSRSGPLPSRSGPFPSRSGPFPHITDSRYSQPISFAEKRRRTLISELPEESQSLQREAWRAASRRYYARKNAPHETEPTQYAHLLQNIAPSGETVEPNREGTQTNSGGILCS